MSYDDCLKVIDELDKCGVRKIHLTGGEPLIHPDFEKILEQLTIKNLFINTLYINGMLLNQKIIDLLKKNNPDIRIQISFDGLSYHDWLIIKNKTPMIIAYDKEHLTMSFFK